MASKRRKVGELHNRMFEYLELLGMSEAAKLEFKGSANWMEALGSYRSPRFDSVTARLSQSLLQIQQPPRPEIDLNKPPPPLDNKVEDEASSDAPGKRKRALRIPESNSIRPSHQVPPIQLSDDSD